MGRFKVRKHLRRTKTGRSVVRQHMRSSPEIRNAYSSLPPEARENARKKMIETFAKKEQDEIVSGFVKALNDPSPEIRAKAIEQLGDEKNKAHVPLIEKMMLTDSSEKVRKEALESLDEIKEHQHFWNK